jgi:glycosyltransferase involved in cell wall biosynthesis
VQSALYGGSIALHRHFGKLRELISAYITPDQFLIGKLREGGYPADRMKSLLNPFDVDQYKPIFEHRGYFVYFGRLVPEKGILVLLEAMKRLRDRGYDPIELQVVGDGSARSEAEAFAQRNGLTNINFLGARYGDELVEVLNGARAVVVPTQWYDNSPLVVHQSFALAKPVIASNIDGIPEIVKDGYNGLLSAPGDVDDLAAKMRLICSDDDLRLQMARNARRMAEEVFTAKRRFDGLLLAIHQATGRCL